ncbi:hypothetical protein ScPMuIL_002645 [Solemya velum]
MTESNHGTAASQCRSDTTLKLSFLYVQVHKYIQQRYLLILRTALRSFQYFRKRKNRVVRSDCLRVAMVPTSTVMLIFHWSSTLSCIYFLLVGALGTQEFYKQPVDKSAVLHGNVVLDCSVKNRVGHLQWTRNGFGLGNERDLSGFDRYTMTGGSTMIGSDLIEEFNLEIQDVNLEDDAEFQCQLQATEAALGIRSRSVHLSIVLPPDSPEIQGGGETVPVVLGIPSNITCLAANGKPAADITWFISGVRVTEGVTSTQTVQADGKRVDTISNLEIKAEETDTGKEIECQASNAALTQPHRTRVVLDVTYAPIITLTVNTSRTIREFDYVRFTCTAAANPFDINWRWYRNRVLIPDETNPTLELGAITRELHGSMITCEGTNSVGSSIMDYSLDIEYGPKFITPPTHATVDPHESASLTCNADGNPPPSVVWKRKGFDQYIGSSSTFTISSVDEGDFGIYVCTASVRGFSDISQVVYLLQNGPPKIVSDVNQYATQGDELAKLECLAMSSPQPQTMFWMWRGEEIDYASAGRFSIVKEVLPYGLKSTLRIQNVKSTDFGAYNCSVRNKYGHYLTTIQLIEKEVLPLSIIIGGSVGGITVIFIIVVACVLYHKYRTSDTDSYTETDSSTEIKKRDKSDSPSEFTKSTLMDQWRQDYNNRYSADFDDIYNKDMKNCNGYGSFMTDPYPPEYQNGTIINEYDNRPEEVLPSERYENAYNTVCSTFRSEAGSRTDFIPNGSVDYTDSYRLPPADMTTSKLATNV